jgi:nucleoside-diphosphate-sugar epimerase
MRKKGHVIYSYDKENGKDILDYQDFCNALKNNVIDTVWHFAAIADLNIMRAEPINSLDINVLGTINICQACVKHKAKLNFISTCCVYGNQNIHPSNEKALPNPAEIYAASKLAGENIIKGYAKSYGLRYNILRIPTTYGPGMRPALGVYVFLDQATKSKPITIHGSGKQTRTLTYIDDVIDALILVAESKVEAETLNISTKESVSAYDMAMRIKQITNSESEIVNIKQRVGQTFQEEIDSSKIFNLLGWMAKTSFNDGLRRTYEWLKQNAQNMQNVNDAENNLK